MMSRPSLIVSRENWSLHRRGYLDQQRHQEKVKEAIKNNLADIVAEESIIMAGKNKIVKVPIRSLQEYRFRFDLGQGPHAGQGKGHTRPGQVLGKDSGGAQGGGGRGVGEEPGIDYYEAELTIEELAEMIFEDLHLPRLAPKKKESLAAPAYRFQDVRQAGLMGNIDKKRTLLASLRRTATHGGPALGNITRDDLRFKTWEETPREDTNAVVLAMMDTSGSMGNFEKYIARSFFFWMVRFLRTKYEHVKVVFIAHHVQAREVTEEEFFTKGESGGTRCSSAYELALRIIEDRYPPVDYNLYPFHFSDGDNLPSDNERCMKLVKKLLDVCNIFGYGEIVSPYYRGSSLAQIYRRIKEPHFVVAAIKDKNDVYPALRKFFGDAGETDA